MKGPLFFRQRCPCWTGIRSKPWLRAFWSKSTGSIRARFNSMPKAACMWKGGGCASMTAEIREEQIRMIKVRVLADLMAYRLRHDTFTREAGLAMIVETRAAIVA